MIQLTTLLAPGALAMPRPPGSPLATTSDFALALATISGPTGVTVAAPTPPADIGVADIDLGDLRQALAGHGMILPDAGVAMPEDPAGGAVAAGVANARPLAETVPAKSRGERRPTDTPAIADTPPAATPVQVILTARAVDEPKVAPGPAEPRAIPTTAGASPGETSHVDAPKSRKRARQAAPALPTPIADPAAMLAPPIVMPDPVAISGLAAERPRPATHTAPAAPNPPVASLAVSPVAPPPVMRPIGDAPAGTQPQPTLAVAAHLIDTTVATPTNIVEPIIVALPAVCAVPPRAVEGEIRLPREPLAPRPAPLVEVARPAPAGAVSPDTSARIVTPAADLGIVPTVLPDATARLDPALGIEAAVAKDPLTVPPALPAREPVVPRLAAPVGAALPAPAVAVSPDASARVIEPVTDFGIVQTVLAGATVRVVAEPAAQRAGIDPAPGIEAAVVKDPLPALPAREPVAPRLAVRVEAVRPAPVGAVPPDTSARIVQTGADGVVPTVLPDATAKVVAQPAAQRARIDPAPAVTNNPRLTLLVREPSEDLATPYAGSRARLDPATSALARPVVAARVRAVAPSPEAPASAVASDAPSVAIGAIDVATPPAPAIGTIPPPRARPAPAPVVARETPDASPPVIQAPASPPSLAPITRPLPTEPAGVAPPMAPDEITPVAPLPPTASTPPVARPAGITAPTPRDTALPAPPPMIAAPPRVTASIVAPVEAVLSTPLLATIPVSPAATAPTVPAPVAAPTPTVTATPAPLLAPAPSATMVLAASPAKPDAAPVVIAAAPAARPVPRTPVVVTVAPAARHAPPTPTQQPAAQAFAAAMFAAEQSLVVVDRDDPAADLAASFPLSGLTSATAPVAVAATTAVQQPALDLARDDWMGSMIERIETIRDDAGVRETRIRLTPDALGSVNVSIAQDDAGVLQVRFDAETPQARAILAEAAPRLAEMAEARGLKLGGAGVDAGADQRRQNAQQPSAPVPTRPVSAANDDTDTDDSRIA